MNPEPAVARLSEGVRVVLRPAKEHRANRLLQQLVSLFRLDVHGDELLGRRARIELELVALVLLLILLFDLAAWTLLFNTFLHSEILALDLWTLPAIGGGLILAILVVLYERQFYTADVSEGWRKVWLPMAARVVVIVVAAVCTAQPVELLFFRQAIAERAHEEGVRLQLVTRWKEFGRLQEERTALEVEADTVDSQVFDGIEGQEYLAARAAHGEAKKTRAELDAEVERSRNNVNYWQGEVSAWTRRLETARADAQTAGNPVELGAAASRAKEAEGRVAGARQSLGAWQGRLRSNRTKLQSVEEGLPGLAEAEAQAWNRFKERRADLTADVEEGLEGVESRQRRIEEWVRQLRTVGVDEEEPIFERPPPGVAESERWTYHYPSYGFFDQVRVLDDLRNGRPPLWKGVSSEESERLATDFGLQDVQRCAPEQKDCDEDSWLRHRQQARLFHWAWLSVLAAAMVVPALVLAMKWLMPEELKRYYSVDWQARHGNLEARAIHPTQGSPAAGVGDLERST